jgi:hypothetical protein
MQSFNNNIISDAYQAVEVRLPGVAAGQTQTQFSFPDLPYLRPRMAWIQAMEVYTLASITNSPISGTALPSLAIMQKTAITIYGSVPGVKQGNEIYQRMPILRLNNMQNATPDPFAQQIIKMNDLEIDWTKTMLTIATTPGNTTDMAFVFGVYFNFQPGSHMNEF